MLVVCIFASAVGALIMCLLVLRDGFAPISRDPARADQDVLITRLGHAAAGACFATTAILATVLVARTPAPRPVPTIDPKVAERLSALDHQRQALGEQVNALDATVQVLREQMAGVVGGVQTLRSRLDQTDTRAASAASAATRAEAAVAKSEVTLKRLSDELAQSAAKVRQISRPVTGRPAGAPPTEIVVPATPRPPVRRTEPADPAQESASLSTPETVVPAAPAPTTPAPPAAVPTPPPAPAAAGPPKPVATAAPKAPAHTMVKSPAAAASAPHDSTETNVADKVRKDWDVIRRGFANAGDDFTAAMRQFGRRLTGRDN